MFTSRHLKEWLEAHITSGARVYNDMIPPTGRVIYIRMLAGAGYSLEGIQDNPSFTLEVRGADRNFDDAEFIAADVDRAILMYGPQPWEFDDGTYIYFIGRTGGGPSEITIADSVGRFSFSCNYYAAVATDL